MEDIQKHIELWRDPRTGAVLPFVDIDMVMGRLETPDRMFTYLNGEVDGQPALLQLAYWRWPGAANWVEQPLMYTGTAVPPEIPPDLDGLPDMELSAPEPWLSDTTPYTASPIFVSTTRPILSRVRDTYTAVLAMGMVLWGIVWFLLRFWQWLRGG